MNERKKKKIEEKNKPPNFTSKDSLDLPLRMLKMMEERVGKLPGKKRGLERPSQGWPCVGQNVLECGMVFEWADMFDIERNWLGYKYVKSPVYTLKLSQKFNFQL